jgi:hypothetical protein
MAEISGVQGSVKIGAAVVEASEWSADLDQAVVDRSNFATNGEPLNAGGQRTGSITMSGPVSTTSDLVLAGITRGSVVAFVLGCAATVSLTVSARVSKVSYTNNKDDGPKWTVNGSQYGAATLTGL